MEEHFHAPKVHPPQLRVESTRQPETASPDHAPTPEEPTGHLPAISSNIAGEKNVDALIPNVADSVAWSAHQETNKESVWSVEKTATAVEIPPFARTTPVFSVTPMMPLNVPETPPFVTLRTTNVSSVLLMTSLLAPEPTPPVMWPPMNVWPVL